MASDHSPRSVCHESFCQHFQEPIKVLWNACPWLLTDRGSSIWPGQIAFPVGASGCSLVKLEPWRKLSLYTFCKYIALQGQAKDNQRQCSWKSRIPSLPAVVCGPHSSLKMYLRSKVNGKCLPLLLLPYFLRKDLDLTLGDDWQWVPRIILSLPPSAKVTYRSWLLCLDL